MEEQENLKMSQFLLTKKGGNSMHMTKILIFLALSLVVGVMSCAEQKVEAPTQEGITKNLVPPKAEVKGSVFHVELSDLKIAMTVNIASKEIVETPSLRGNIKITNKSRDVLDIQAVTLEYLDETGKLIPFKPEEKIEKVRAFWEGKRLQPEDITEGSLEVTIPRGAIKERPLGKIEVNLVYVPLPLKREVLILPEKIKIE